MYPKKMNNLFVITFKSLRRTIAALLFFSLITHLAVAQLTEHPIPRKVQISKSSNSGRIKSDVPVSLPFWDDFSGTTTGYPDTLWVNSQTTSISDGAGINSPSINVATFNGLDSVGNPYSPNEPTMNGLTDKLISRKIKMSEVPEAERSSVYLSFFYQWRGNGEAPDDNDYIRLEFKNNQGNWVAIQTITGGGDFDPDIFSSVNIPITDAQYYHDDFQFAIRSYGRMSGPYDTWMVDYIYLDKGRNNSQLSFPDRAASSAISKLFESQYAVPVKHFFFAKKLDSVEFDVQNLRGPTFGGASINYKATAKYYNYIGENPPTVYNETLINSRGVRGESGAMLPYERVRVKLDTLPDPNNPLAFNPDADEIRIQLKMKVISNDSIDPELPAFLPIDFRVNDTISAWYTLKDYYAYDDGTAEYSAGLTQPGNRLAYRFDMLIDTATLQGFQIYFPYLGGPNSETLDFFVYGNDNGQPSSSPIYSALSRTVTKNGNNEFFTISIEPLFISDTTFYIGYKEPVSSTLEIGLDKSNDTGDKMYVYIGNSWLQNTDVHGSLMIRPLFGKGTGDIVTGISGENKGASIYPNPNRGEFYIEDEVNQLDVIDIMGKPVSWEIESQDMIQKVTLTSPASGYYVVRWANKRGTYQRKIIVNK